MAKERKRPARILVAGATGYVGGRLVPRLLESGYQVRCVVRDAGKVGVRPWSGAAGLEVVEGDIGDLPALTAAMEGCDAAYYLIHSMISRGSDYRDEDRRLATAFASAATQAGLPRIIYLGGLGETGDGLSEHLESRREVEKLLSSGSARVTVLRAAMIIGSGSASFEILRYLVERLPLMVTPRWVSTQCQPISIRDTLHFLLSSLENPETQNRILDIGGPETLRYLEIMQMVAEELGIPRRIIVPVPVLTPRLSSLWIHLVTPVGSDIARPLAEGLRNPVVCRDGEAARLMPGELTPVREAIRDAIREGSSGAIESSWTDAGVMPGDPEWAGGTVYEDRRSTRVQASPEVLFDTICRVGGPFGWFNTSWLWWLRGVIDRLLGGPGLGRGRRHQDRLDYGDAVDFWRVSIARPHSRLELRAEMKLPGTAILDFRIEPGSDCTNLVQTARFRPRGLPGLLYWFAVAPFHNLVFAGMLRGIKKSAEDD